MKKPSTNDVYTFLEEVMTSTIFLAGKYSCKNPTNDDFDKYPTLLPGRLLEKFKDRSILKHFTSDMSKDMIHLETYFEDRENKNG